MKLKLLQIDNNNEGDNPAGWFKADVTAPGPESKDGRPVVVPGTMKPLNIESLSLEEQAIAQVLADLVAKAENAGIKDPEIDLTPDMVRAKMKQLKKERRNRKQHNRTR
jgi:hypothetical protein